MSRKGIVLAGGEGTRLYPLTHVVSKQLMPVYDKPMVYYPLSTLMLAGIREMLIITTPADRERFRELLGDGSRWGVRLEYAAQDEPRGIADALLVGREFLAGDPSALILGDNLFFGHGLPGVLRKAAALEKGATVFGYRVSRPERYGVVRFDERGRPEDIVEKPADPPSPYAVTGLYFYDGRAPDLAAELEPSERGELEITDLNRRYLEAGELKVEKLGRGYAWLDTGTHDSLLDAASFIRTVEERQGLKVACPEEVAWRMGYIDSAQVKRLAEPLRGTGYGEYLVKLLEEEGDGDRAGRAGPDGGRQR